MKRTCAFFLSLILVLVGALPAGAGEGDLQWSGNLAFRTEWFDAPSANPDRIEKYGMSHVRLRGFLDYKQETWGVHLGVQGVTSTGLREGLSFGIGPVYSGANRNVDIPGKVFLHEAEVNLSLENVTGSLGRMKYADGTETMTGVTYLDGVKKKRIGERLIGNWEWVSVGRRFDGVKAGAGTESFWAHAFYLMPLQGGVNYVSGYEWFDEIAIMGGSVAAKYNVIPKTELRAFVYQYEDKREAIATKPKVTTIGGTVLVGNETSDGFVWVAYQTGDWGDMDQNSLAFIVEAGHVFEMERPLKARVGFAQAGGDDKSTGTEHKSFFNMMPTNHKWYGMMDYNAFSNLRDIYIDLGWAAFSQWNFGLGAHSFALVEKTDAWYGGSGAFNDTVFGYAGRRPAGGDDFTGNNLGFEVDATGAWKFAPGAKLAGGMGYFSGGDAAKEVLTVSADGFWGFLMGTYSF